MPHISVPPSPARPPPSIPPICPPLCCVLTSPACSLSPPTPLSPLPPLPLSLPGSHSCLTAAFGSPYGSCFRAVSAPFLRRALLGAAAMGGVLHLPNLGGERLL